MKRLALVLAASLALAGCVSDRVTLLEPEPDHRVGGVAILADDGSETVLDEPNTLATLSRRNPRVRPVNDRDPNYDALMATLPPPVVAYRLTFPVGDFEISERHAAVIEQIRAEIARRPGAQVEVAGFTDSTGEPGFNYDLSVQRAESVAQELRAFGFPIGPEDAVGRGEYDAVAELGENVSDENYRRVDIIIR